MYANSTAMFMAMYSFGFFKCTCFADFGKESSVALDNMNVDQVAKALETVVKSKA